MNEKKGKKQEKPKDEKWRGEKVTAEDPLYIEWKKKVSKWFNDKENTEPFVSHRGAVPKLRTVLHMIAEEFGITSVSKGEGKHRTVIITREKRKLPNPEELDSTTKRKFREWYGLRINL